MSAQIINPPVSAGSIAAALGFTPAATAISPIPVGTALAPGAAFSGDTGTGLQQSRGAGTLSISLSGADFFDLTPGGGLQIANDSLGLNSTPRRKLTNTTNFYVNSSTGNDSNNGLSTGAPFLTIQGAINYLKSTIDFNGNQVILNLADGTYAGFTVNGGFVGENNTTIFAIVGNTGTPANVVITSATTNAARIYDVDLSFVGVAFGTTGTGGCGLQIGNQAYVEIGNVRFNSCIAEMLLLTFGAALSATGPITVAGNASSFLHCTNRSRASFETQTVTFVGTPAFSTYVVGVNDASASFASGTLVGDKTGQTYAHIAGTINLSSMTGKLFGTDRAPVWESGGRIVPAAPINTVYVRTDGSDNNDGSANDATHAFLTIAAAINWLKTIPYDQLNSLNPVIQVGDGTWTVPVVLIGLPNVNTCTIQGNVATPANCIISAAGGSCIGSNNNTTKWIANGFTLTNSAGTLLAAGFGGLISFANVVFGSSSGAQISISRGGDIENTGSYAISGGATNHIFCDAGRYSSSSGTVTITNTPAYSSAFARCADTGYMRVSPTWSGSATGTRYNSMTNGVIDTNGGGATVLPGNGAGTTATGGQYV